MSGNEAVFTAYLTHRAALVDAAARIVGCRHRAEDVVQDAYVRLAETAAAAEIRHPASYVFRLVRNLAIDRVRRLALEIRHGAMEEVPPGTPADLPSPEQATIAEDTLRVLESALAELPERTRLAFELSRVAGYPVERIAETLGVSVRLVYLLLRDAMSHCRRRLLANGIVLE